VTVLKDDAGYDHTKIHIGSRVKTNFS